MPLKQKKSKPNRQNENERLMNACIEVGALRMVLINLGKIWGNQRSEEELKLFRPQQTTARWLTKLTNDHYMSRHTAA